VRISFDLYILGTWDGSTVNYPPETADLLPAASKLLGPEKVIGPDLWDFLWDGNPLVHASFSNWPQLNFRQSYPLTHPAGDFPAQTGAAAVNSLGYLMEGMPFDSTYHMTHILPHTADTLTLDFSSLSLQALSDESWGLDNLVITLVNAGEFLPFHVYLPAVLQP
jgi:hypothetical protein